MGKKPETRLVNQIFKALKAEGSGWWFKVHGSAFQASGVPDILGCYHGWFVGLEVKMPGEKPTARQEWIMSLIHKAGGVAVVVRNPEHVMSILDTLRRKTW